VISQAGNTWHTKHCFKQSDEEEKPSDNYVMTEFQRQTVNKLRQQMANMRSQRTKNK